MNGFFGNANRIGTDIRNQTRTHAVDLHTFIQLLGQHHRFLGCKAKLSGCVLLQNAGSKRRRRILTF